MGTDFTLFSNLVPFLTEIVKIARFPPNLPGSRRRLGCGGRGKVQLEQ